MTSTTRLRIFLHFAVIMLASFSADAAEVYLKPRADSRGALVLLGDVAEIRGATDELRTALERVELFPAPNDDRSRTLHARELRELLSLHGANVHELRFTGSRAARIHPKPRDPPPPARPEPKREETPPPQVVVAKRQLQRGDVLREADVEVRPLPETARAGSYANRLEDVVGRETLQPVAVEQPIDARHLRRPLLVRRGDAVRVVARAAGVQVSTTAKAVEDGALGDLVILQSLENREKFSAQVTGLQQAEVYASGVRAIESPRQRMANRSSISTEQ